MKLYMKGSFMKKIVLLYIFVFASHCVTSSAARPEIDLRAKERLRFLLEDPTNGFGAKLQALIPQTPQQGSLQELQQAALFKQQEFETTCRLATQEVNQHVAGILKDFDVDRASYSQYLQDEYADLIDQKARQALQNLQKYQDRQVKAALKREKDAVYQASRPFRWGSSLVTNIVKDAREDITTVAPIVGAGAVGLQYAPIKTREKIEEGIGSALVQHPGYAAASLAGLIAGWQGVKYGMRYFTYRNQAADLEKKAQAIKLVPEWNQKAIFIAHVPAILQSAREGATIVRLEHEVGSLVRSSQLNEQELRRVADAVRAQESSLQSLQTLAQAHGASLESVREKLSEVCDRQKAHTQQFGQLSSEFGGLRSDVRDIRTGVGRLLAISTQDAYASDSDMPESASAIVSGAGARAHSVRSQSFSFASHASADSTIARMIAAGQEQASSVRILGALPSASLEPESHRIRSARRESGSARSAFSPSHQELK